VLWTLLASIAPGLDTGLLHRIARGDERALRKLYDAYGGRVLATARRLLGSAAEAEEIVQETFVEVWNRASTFDSERGSAAAWIASIGRNRAIDRLRSRAVRERTMATIEREGRPAEPAPDALVDRARTNRQLTRALEQLSPDQRIVVELAYLDGLSQSEIAARTGHPLGTIKGRARAALQKLAEHMAREAAP